MNFKSFLKIISILLSILLIGCTLCNKNCKYSEEIFLEGGRYQHQKAVSLTLLRFISIFKQLKKGEDEELKKNIDWWIDSMILELNMHEDEFRTNILPEELEQDIREIKKNLESEQPDIPSYEYLYKQFAKYRRDYPRIHTIPLGEKEIEVINNFVKKYQ